MTLSEVITELERLQAEHGDIKVQLQNAPTEPEQMITGDEVFFLVPEEYEGETVLNIRSWPY